MNAVDSGEEVKEMRKLCREVGRKKSILSDENARRQKCNVHEVLSSLHVL